MRTKSAMLLRCRSWKRHLRYELVQLSGVNGRCGHCGQREWQDLRRHPPERQRDDVAMWAKPAMLLRRRGWQRHLRYEVVQLLVIDLSRTATLLSRAQLGRSVVVLRLRHFAVPLVLAACIVVHASPSEARRSPASILRALDTNHDGAIDLAEATGAASALFDQLDTDGKAELTVIQLKGRLSKPDFTDGSATITKARYLAIVEQRFRDADANHDAKLDIKELSSPAGGELVKLIFYVIID